MEKYINFKEALEQELQNPEFKAQYDKLKPWRELQIALIDARKKANLTQEELASRLGIKRPNLAKFETSLENPTFDSLVKYARAVGLKKIVIDLD